MNNLYEALEVCLQDMEQGADIETVLFRYPALAEELRPILEASASAKGLAVQAPSAEVVRRNRAKLLQRAAEMREAKARPVLPFTWSASLRRAAVTLVLFAILFASGTSLVRAASTTLPGDNLYPVKRTWESMSLLFTFDLQQREALEIQHENERLEELNELLAKGRSEGVDFSGRVTGQNGDQWLVAGIPVVISARTELPDQPVAVGDAVRVRGVTGGDGLVLAERVQLLPPGARLPDAEHQGENEESSNQGTNQENEDNSGPGSGSDEPHLEETESPESHENSGSNSGSGSEPSSNENSGSGDNSNDENINDSSSSDQNSNDGSSNDRGSDHSSSNENSQNDNSSEDSSYDGGNSGSGSEGGGGEGEESDG